MKKAVAYLIAGAKVVFCLGCLGLFYASALFIAKNISKELSKGILEYLKVMIWPSVVLVGIMLFRSDISGFLRRLVKGNIPGLGEWEASPLGAQEKSNIGTEIIQPSGGAFDQIVAQKEEEIKALKNNQQQLIDSLTKAQIELDFERVYNFIFASQIDLLSQINNFNGEVATAYAVEHFARVQQIFPILGDWNFTKYLEFLMSNQLLEYKQGVGSFLSIVLTLKGKAFIAYITARSYKKNGL